MIVEGAAGKLHVDDGGPASGALPVLLVHGLGGNSSHWAAQLRSLRRSRRAAALDLRGHGRSELRDGARISIEDLAGDVAAAADALAWKKFVLAGFSIGGSIAGCYAGRNPQRVAGLFLVDPASAFDRRPQADKDSIRAVARPPYGELRASVLELSAARPAVRHKISADFDAVPLDRSAALLSSLTDYDATSALERYLKSGPVLIALSAENRDNPYRLAALVPHVEERVIEDTSHWIMLDAPDEVQPLLDGFLERLE